MDRSLITFKIPMTAEGKVMGEVRVKVRLTNSMDAALARRGELEPNQVRSKVVEAVVDTGAVCTVVPKTLVRELGLELVKERKATYANGESELVGSSEPIWIELEGRGAFDEALALGNEVLIGQTVLEKTDLLVDCKNKCLIPGHEEGEILFVR